MNKNSALLEQNVVGFNYQFSAKLLSALKKFSQKSKDQKQFRDIYKDLSYFEKLVVKNLCQQLAVGDIGFFNHDLEALRLAAEEFLALFAPKQTEKKVKKDYSGGLNPKQEKTKEEILKMGIETFFDLCGRKTVVTDLAINGLNHRNVKKVKQLIGLTYTDLLKLDGCDRGVIKYIKSCLGIYGLKLKFRPQKNKFL